MKVLLLVILFSINARAADIDKRRDGIINLLNEELTEVTRLSSQVDHQNPNLLLRMGQINLEKARLLKEKENDTYLSISPEERSKKNKEAYFQNSKQFFINAQKVCLQIIERFPNYKAIGDVYYIVGQIAKETNQDDKAKKYFEMAIQKQGGDPVSKNKSKLAMAEMLFNSKEYSKAMPLYEDSMDPKSRWWTKDSFNLAWCYFQTGKYDKAINLMREVFEKSSNGQYVDMSNVASRDLGLFYAEAGKTDEAINFYKKIGKNFSEQLLKLGRHLIDQGKTTQAENALNEALKYEQNDEAKKEIYITQLALFDRYGRFDKHLETSEQLVKLHERGLLNQDDITVLKFQAGKMGAILQKQATDITYKHDAPLRKKKAEQSIAYFAIVGKFEQAKTVESTYLQAETLYGSEQYEASLKYYEAAYDQAAKKPDAKYLKLSVEGMLAVLGQKELSEKTKEKYYEQVYVRYLNYDPKSERSKEIYQKLFNVYTDKKDLANSERVVTAYRKNFPDDVLTQEKMLEFILAGYSKSNPEKFKEWLGKINSGEFVVTPKFAERLRTELTAVQLSDAQKLEDSGKKNDAIKNYHNVYTSKDSTAEAKETAAYNLAVLFYKAHSEKQYYYWAAASLAFMKAEKIKKYEETFETMATELFYRQEFDAARDLSIRAMKKICNANMASKPVYFKIATQVLISENRLEESAAAIDEGERCKIEPKHLNEARFLLMDALIKDQRYEMFNKTLNELESQPILAGKLIFYYSELMKAYQKAGNSELASSCYRKMFSSYEAAQKAKSEISANSRDIIAHYNLLEMEKQVKQFNDLRITFPEDVFNKTMKKKFQQLEDIKNAMEKIFLVGSGKGIVRAAQLTVEAQQKFVKEVKEFTPTGKEEGYVKAFKKDMDKNMAPILQDSLTLISETKRAIKDEKILSHDNNWFLSDRRFPIELEYRYVYDGVTMDRGGKK